MRSAERAKYNPETLARLVLLFKCFGEKCLTERERRWFEEYYFTDCTFTSIAKKFGTNGGRVSVVLINAERKLEFSPRKIRHSVRKARWYSEQSDGTLEIMEELCNLEFIKQKVLELGISYEK